MEDLDLAGLRSAVGFQWLVRFWKAWSYSETPCYSCSGSSICSWCPYPAWLAILPAPIYPLQAPSFSATWLSEAQCSCLAFRFLAFCVSQQDLFRASLHFWVDFCRSSRCLWSNFWDFQQWHCLPYPGFVWPALSTSTKLWCSLSP